MQENSVEKLKYEFEKIKKRGYIKTTGEGIGIGKTFEDLLGNSLDYYGIQIRTKRGYTKTLITLFSLNIKGPSQFKIKRLRDVYGYSDKNNHKALYCSFYGDCYTLIANKYLFKAKVSYNDKKVYLVILNHMYEVIEDYCYWDFEDFKEKLETKLAYLALVKVWPRVINGDVYFHYYRMMIFKLRDFETFLKLLERGVIKITFKISYISGEWMGYEKDKRTTFQIDEKNLELLFERIY